MTLLATFPKQPAERKDYDVDYADWLRFDPSDSLDAVEAVVLLTSGEASTPLVVERVDITATRAKLWVKGGADRATYKVEITATTQMGRIDQSELRFKVKDH